MPLRRVVRAIAALAGPPGGDDLRRCTGCHGSHVCPMDWEESGDSHWRILTRCGDCGRRCETIVTNAQAAQLDRDLDRDVDTIRRAATRLDLERMAAEVDAFAAALAHDLIGAADFAE